jgi:DNA-binding response OmpR family regulator
VVIDEPAVAELITLTLNHGAYTTRAAKTMAQALVLMDAQQPRLAVVDMDVVNGQFIEHLVRAAERQPRLPILALTRRGDLKSKLTAFDQGVDDIMALPFSPEELLARMIALTRRAYGDRVKLSPVIKVGGLEIDILNRQVRAGSTQLNLTGVEQSLLYLLAANAGQTLGRDQIIDALWGADYVPSSNIVDRHVRNLRSKLGDPWRAPRFIATVPGRGYRFIPPVP